MSRWKDFTDEELNCSCCGKSNPNPEWVVLMDDIQWMRSYLDFPFPITSGYRCEDHPIESYKVSQGKPLGQHTKAAVDIGIHHNEAFKVLDLAMTMGFAGGIGVNQKGDHDTRFLHLDYRDTMRTLWSY